MPGRRRVLDEAKMREICALLSVGCSRNQVAEYVGCATSTIENTIRHDKAFAEKVRQAETEAEVALLRNVRQAGLRNWRAAAWALERLKPQRYARRRADYLTFEEVDEFIAELGVAVFGGLPPGPGVDEALRRMDKLIDDYEEVSSTESQHERSRRVAKLVARRKLQQLRRETALREQQDAERNAQWEAAWQAGQPAAQKGQEESKGLEARGSGLGNEEPAAEGEDAQGKQSSG